MEAGGEAVLNDDVLVEIFGHLTRTRDMLSVLMVSKRWHALMRSTGLAPCAPACITAERIEFKLTYITAGLPLIPAGSSAVVAVMGQHLFVLVTARNEELQRSQPDTLVIFRILKKGDSASGEKGGKEARGFEKVASMELSSGTRGYAQIERHAMLAWPSRDTVYVCQRGLASGEDRIYGVELDADGTFTMRGVVQSRVALAWIGMLKWPSAGALCFLQKPTWNDEADVVMLDLAKQETKPLGTIPHQRRAPLVAFTACKDEKSAEVPCFLVTTHTSAKATIWSCWYDQAKRKFVQTKLATCQWRSDLGVQALPGSGQVLLSNLQGRRGIFVHDLWTGKKISIINLDSIMSPLCKAYDGNLFFLAPHPTDPSLVLRELKSVAKRAKSSRKAGKPELEWKVLPLSGNVCFAGSHQRNMFMRNGWLLLSDAERVYAVRHDRNQAFQTDITEFLRGYPGSVASAEVERSCILPDGRLAVPCFFADGRVMVLEMLPATE